MALTTRADIARAMYIGTKEVFMKNLQKQPEEEWKAYNKIIELENFVEPNLVLFLSVIIVVCLGLQVRNLKILWL